VYCKFVGVANVLFLHGSHTGISKCQLQQMNFELPSSLPFVTELLITCCRLEKEELERAKEVDRKVVLDTRKEIEISRLSACSGCVCFGHLTRIVLIPRMLSALASLQRQCALPECCLLWSARRVCILRMLSAFLS
jgi:hypothetical protein